MSSGGLLSYYGGGDEDDDYHLPSRSLEKSRSKKYEELTQSLKTGNAEYGLHYPEGTPRDHYLQSDSNDKYDFMTGSLKPRAGKSKSDSGAGTPNFGRRRLITDPKSVGAPHISNTRSLAQAESPALLPRRLIAKDRNGGLPKLTSESSVSSPRGQNDYKSNDYSYRDVQQAYMSSKTADSVKLSDIAQIDLVLTLNDKTKVVVKAAPFKPFQF